MKREARRIQRPESIGDTARVGVVGDNVCFVFSDTRVDAGWGSEVVLVRIGITMKEGCSEDC